MTIRLEPKLETEPEEIATRMTAMRDFEELQTQRQIDSAQQARHDPNYYIVILEERIFMAQKILKSLLPEQLEGYSKDVVKCALKALQGK